LKLAPSLLFGCQTRKRATHSVAVAIQPGDLLADASGWYQASGTFSIGKPPARPSRSRKKNPQIADFVRAFWKTVASSLLSQNLIIVSCSQEGSRRDRACVRQALA
jgi:hypothetical protein